MLTTYVSNAKYLHWRKPAMPPILLFETSLSSIVTVPYVYPRTPRPHLAHPQRYVGPLRSCHNPPPIGDPIGKKHSTYKQTHGVVGGYQVQAPLMQQHLDSMRWCHAHTRHPHFKLFATILIDEFSTMLHMMQRPMYFQRMYIWNDCSPIKKGTRR